ncbi:MAG TPA: hypothetical protein VMJ11_31665 [Paraburkholderia sp.]|uniref:hypothetical protein n=1 Tax=Paraburkholderia sp. TaxID=1926495 RepID=UPI002C269422|nr:hypothetical protein [Paraburkholderia sp.]HTR11133.1 hypothetical protein [Paraburkholderia sp.]
MALSSATGTNSVVLKTNAESANASTPHQACLEASGSGVGMAGSKRESIKRDYRVSRAGNALSMIGTPVRRALR